MHLHHTHTCIHCSTPFTPTQNKKTAKFCSFHCYQDHRMGGFRHAPHSTERYMALVDTSGGPDACWPWTGNVNKGRGYGQTRWKDKCVFAHRAIYMSIHGELPSSVIVRHKCDNRLCCNPDHLEPGSHADNMRDMKERGRRARPRFESHPQAKLTWDDVRWMRGMNESGEFNGVTHKEVAKMFGVTRSVISHILAYRTWVED